MNAKATANKVNNKGDKIQPYFSPPWAARQFCEALIELGYPLHDLAALDPCGGMGHLVHGMRDYYGKVYADDLENHNPRHFTPTPNDYVKTPHHFAGHVVTNPPFCHMNKVAMNAIRCGASLVALLVRIPALAGQRRKEDLFDIHPPSYTMVHTVRPHMRRGPPPETGGDSAMDMVWVVWDMLQPIPCRTIFLPNTRVPYEREGDYFDTMPGKTW